MKIRSILSSMAPRYSVTSLPCRVQSVFTASVCLLSAHHTGVPLLYQNNPRHGWVAEPGLEQGSLTPQSPDSVPAAAPVGLFSVLAPHHVKDAEHNAVHFHGPGTH